MPGLLTAVHLKGTRNDPPSRDKGWSVEISILWESLRYLRSGARFPSWNSTGSLTYHFT